MHCVSYIARDESSLLMKWKGGAKEAV